MRCKDCQWCRPDDRADPSTPLGTCMFPGKNHAGEVQIYGAIVLDSKSIPKWCVGGFQAKKKIVSCKSCRFFEEFTHRLPTDLDGECQRFPPVWRQSSFGEWVQPLTRSVWKCGEWKPKEEASE